MALTITQLISVTGVSTINGEQVAYFSAQIPQGNGSSTFNRNITNQELYDANRKEVRSDESEFQSKVYEVEDGLLQ
ncbi:hypothetical protein LMG9449_2788 [Lactococcus lactis subsp. lactis]|uniref:Prophage protein n=1 Tax=Lactococcus lactis subsp. lactis TaxID=1360 RepID=A0A0V8DJT5_LACLL|nr:hypothetical protein [Lactococcus lactis]KSU13658.1 hypothetical protein LMG9449_2788 [Lactococcus lactis subsp. lactis]